MKEDERSEGWGQTRGPETPVSLFSKMSSHKERSRRVTRSEFFKSIIPTAGLRTDGSGQAQEQGDRLGPGERGRWVAPGCRVGGRSSRILGIVPGYCYYNLVVN